MEIGLFQLENLFSNPNRFLFFDLRLKRDGLPKELEIYFQKATAVGAADLLSYLKQNAVAAEMPLVLVCEDGQSSTQAAELLESEGYLQTYVVAGGVTGLLSEL
jgi:rhodanese-related sulfurtransferase